MKLETSFDSIEYEKSKFKKIIITNEEEVCNIASYLLLYLFSTNKATNKAKLEISYCTNIVMLKIPQFRISR